MTDLTCALIYKHQKWYFETTHWENKVCIRSSINKQAVGIILNENTYIRIGNMFIIID